jgi:stage II sporulation protein AA (anti-sigma F factor antagonist)
MLNFDLQTARDGTSALITIRGDFDLQVAGDVADEVARVESNEPQSLVFDLRRLSFMDSSGMAVLASAHARALAANRAFAIVRPPPGVMRTFEISGFSDVVRIVDDVADAYP